MANIKVDTTRLESDGKRILQLASQYDTLIEDFFTKLDNTLRSGWSGSAATNYLNNLKLEKAFFKSFTNYLNNYGNELVNHATQLESVIKKWDE